MVQLASNPSTEHHVLRTEQEYICVTEICVLELAETVNVVSQGLNNFHEFHKCSLTLEHTLKVYLNDFLP